MPEAKVRVRLGQGIVTRKEKILQHAEQVKVHEQWSLAEQKW